MEYGYYNMDCMEGMRRFPDKYFDLSIVDPPYFSGPERREYYGRKVSPIGVQRHYEPSENWEVPGEEYFHELERVSKHQIVWGCNYFDWDFPPGRIVWDKCNGNSSFSDCEIASCRVIEELRPSWVIGENVAGIIRMALDDVLSDLENQGYATGTFVLPAAGVGAMHRRYRTAIVAHTDCIGVERNGKKQILGESHISVRQISEPFQDAERRYDTYQSRLCRSLYGLPNGVDRVRSLGNAVVPQQFYPIFQAIANIGRY